MSQQNPYQQPGYQQPNPYQGQAPWDAPTQPSGTPPQDPGRGGGRRTKVVAMAGAAAVVVAAGATGLLLLGGDKDDNGGPTDPEPGQSQPTSPVTDTANPRQGGKPQPTVAGWKAVVNPKTGIAFDVPADWALRSQDWVSWVSENDDPDDKPLVAMAAPAYLKEKWCTSDDDRNGSKESTPLAGAGSRGVRGAKSTAEIARKDAATWVYGGYTQPDRKLVETGPVESYTTKSGIKGSLATATSSGVPKKDKCDTDGKATVFAFKNSAGDFASWAFQGAHGVRDEVPDATVRKILATVREYKEPREN